MGDETTPADMSLGGETIKGTAAKFVTLAVGFIGSIVLARSLGPAAYGGFYALLAVVEIVDRPVRGWASAGKKRASEAEANRDEIATALIGVLAVFLLLASFGVVLAGDFLQSYAELSAAVTMFVALLVSTTLYVTIRALVEARGFVGLAMWTNTARNATTVPLQIVLAIPLGLGFGAAGMAYGYALGTVLVVPVVAYYARVWITTPSMETLRSLWSYAKYSIPSGFVGKVYSRFDLLLIGALIGPASAAHYEVAYRVSLPATFLSGVAASALLPRVSHLITSDASIREDIATVLSFASLLSMPVFFGAVAIADDLVIVLYGTEYAEAGLLLVGIALYRVVKSQSAPLRSVVKGIDRPDYDLYLSTVVLTINVVLGIALLLKYGPIGVVAATVFAEALRYVGFMWFLRRELSGLRFFPRPVLEQVVAAAIMCAIVLAVLETITLAQPIEITIALAVGAISYAGVLLAGSEHHRDLAADGLDRLGRVRS